jgi:hypothetical protein
MEDLLNIEMPRVGDSCSLSDLGQKKIFQAYLRRHGGILADRVGEVSWYIMDTDKCGCRTTILKTEPIDYNLLFASQPNLEQKQLPTPLIPSIPLIPAIVYEHIVTSGIEGVDMTVIMKNHVFKEAIQKTGYGLSVLVKEDARVIMKMNSKVVYCRPE